jgi:hypothetical protein
VRIVLGKSDGRNAHLDIDGLLSGRLLVQANSGKGKSWLLRRIAEQLFGKVQVIIIDPEGEFASLREKYDYVLVGKGGETPADPRSAQLLAHTLLKLHASAVCDLYELKPATRHEWVSKFLDAVIDAPKELWHAVIFIVDEAHVYCPEKGAGESQASEAMVSLTTRGRKRGFGSIWATQRLGKLRKDAAAELYNVLVGGTFMDIDRKRAADVLGVYGKDIHPFFDEIKLLKPGLFFALGPAISQERILIQVGGVETTHPEAGSAKHAAEPPPAPAKIQALLPKLADLPKAAEEQAKSVAEMRSEIRSLKAQLRAQPKVTPAKETVKEVVSQNAIRRAVIQAETKIIRIAQKGMTDLEKFCIGIQEELKKLSERRFPVLPKFAVTEIKIPVERVSVPVKKEPIFSQRAQDEEVSRSNGKLRAGAERMLAALSQWHPEGMTEGQMRAHAGLRKSGTFSAYMSDLRRNGYIEERNGLIYASEQGLEYCQHVPAAPQSTQEVVDIWRPKLRDGARRMLDVLVELGGDPITKEELGERANLQKSGTFSAYLSDLKTARLAIVGRDGTVAANKETLFL